MAVRVSGMVLRICFALELALGVLFWFNIARNLTLLHMFLGIVIVGLVWFIGLAQATVPGGNLRLVAATYLAGLALAVMGMTQSYMLVGRAHWIVQIIHLLLALGALACAEISLARYTRGKRAVQRPA